MEGNNDSVHIDLSEAQISAEILLDSDNEYVEVTGKDSSSRSMEVSIGKGESLNQQAVDKHTD
jgi:hypothetical protein